MPPQTRKPSIQRRVPPFLWVIVVSLAMFAGYQVYKRFEAKQAAPGAFAERGAEAGTLAGRAAPDFALRDLNGHVRSLRDYRGRVLILNFWATWCRPCKMEIPDFIALQESYRSKGVRFVGVSVDEPGQEAMLRSFVRGQGINYDVLLADENITALYGGIQSIPTTFVIGADGAIRATFSGLQSKEVWAKQIEKALAAQ